ncbi:archease [Candidatus Woesearchaeota archaeon]|nr:archease [Candidatus Woesearchaeota archaeon]
MVDYKFISDSVFEAYGKNLKELFENAAIALSSFICKIDKVKPKEAEEFLMKGDNLESTLSNWLSGLITIIIAEKKFFSKFEVEEVDENHVKVKIWGEPIKPEVLKNTVTSIDYSKYKIEKTKEGYKAIVGLKVLNEI